MQGKTFLTLLALMLATPAALAFGLPPSPSSPPTDDAGEIAAWGILYGIDVTDYTFDTASEASLEALTASVQATDYSFCKLYLHADCVVFLDATVEEDTYYVEAGRSAVAAAGVWQETNGCAGLQKSPAGTCAADARLA